MNDREKIVRLLNRVPERKLGYVLAYVQGITADEDEPALTAETESAGAAELERELALAAEIEAAGAVGFAPAPEAAAAGAAGFAPAPEAAAANMVKLASAPTPAGAASLTAEETVCMRAYRHYMNDPDRGDFIPLEQALRACRVSPNEL